LIELLTTFIVSLFVAFLVTLPYVIDAFKLVSVGIGLLPLTRTLTVPPSETTFTVSVNVPNEAGLNLTVSAVLSPPATVVEPLVAMNAVVLVVTPLIVIALIEVFRKHPVIVAESPLTRLAKAREVIEALSTGAGVLPESGIFTNGVAELLWRYTVSV
jgi:hypothetical protein